jgi:predicted ATPase
MLTKITLTNFFSFGKETTIELNPDINILVGINGSGKSNFLRALEFLYEGVAGDGIQKLLIQKWGGLDNVISFTQKNNSVRFEYEFQIGFKNILYSILLVSNTNTSYSFSECIKYKRGSSRDEQWKVFMRSSGTSDGYVGGSYLLEDNDEKLTDISQTNNFDSTKLLLGQLPTKSIWFGNFIFFIKSLKIYNTFNTSHNSPIRHPNILGQGTALNENGDNLNSVIQNLQNNHAIEYDKIEEKLKDINPNFKGVSFNYFGSKVYLSLREKHLRKVIPIEQISDGTLHYLALLAIFFNPQRGQLVAFDEPETGLHPDMINTIANAIKEAARENTQLFVATHSPLLLNSFDIEDLIVFEKDSTNQTTVTKKTEEDFEDWNDDFLIGQLWLRGQIGGKRW